MSMVYHRRWWWCQFGELVVALEAAPLILVEHKADDLRALQNRVYHSTNSHGVSCVDSGLENADCRAVLAYPEPEADLEPLARNFRE